MQIYIGRIPEVAGRITHTVISILLLTYLIFLVIFYFLHENMRVTVDRINYEVAEVISTSAIFTGNLYSYLEDSILKYGEYKISLRLDKQVKSGIYDTFFDIDDIIDKPLRVGDRLTIHLKDQDMSLFDSLLNATIPGYRSSFFDNRIESVYTAVISKNYIDLVKGYDVIADIRKYSNDESVAILVITKLNSSGKFYGSASHVYVDTDNTVYGDTQDEWGNTGVNYIFDNGDFLREVEVYPDGLIKLIKYSQQ